MYSSIRRSWIFRPILPSSAPEATSRFFIAGSCRRPTHRGRDEEEDVDRSWGFQMISPSSAPVATTSPLSSVVDIAVGSGSNSTTTISTMASSTMAPTGSQSRSTQLEPVNEITENSPTRNRILHDDDSESTYVLSPLALNFVTPQLRSGDEPGAEIDDDGFVDSDSSSVMSEMSLHTAPTYFDSESLGGGHEV